MDIFNLCIILFPYLKVYGPKGVGALYVRRRPRVRVEPIQSGGGQERGLRLVLTHALKRKFVFTLIQKKTFCKKVILSAN